MRTKEPQLLKLIERIAEKFAKKALKYNELFHTLLRTFYRHIIRITLKLDIVKSMSLLRNANANVVGVWNGQKLPISSIAEAAMALGEELV